MLSRIPACLPTGPSAEIPAGSLPEIPPDIPRVTQPVYLSGLFSRLGNDDGENTSTKVFVSEIHL